MSANQLMPLGREDVHVYIASLDCPPSELRFYENMLSKDEVDRSKRFYRAQDRERFVAGRGMLRTILSAYVKTSPGELVFAYGSHGKPLLQEQPHSGPAINFNLAHSAGTAIYAVTQNRSIGVDIEFIKHQFPVESVAARFFSPLEVAALRALPTHLQRTAFFKCWTRKEAFVKAIGDGLSCPLDAFSVSLMPGEPARLLNVEWASEEASRWSMKDIEHVPECAAAVVAEGSHCRLHLSEWASDRDAM